MMEFRIKRQCLKTAGWMVVTVGFLAGHVTDLPAQEKDPVEILPLQTLPAVRSDIPDPPESRLESIRKESLPGETPQSEAESPVVDRTAPQSATADQDQAEPLDLPKTKVIDKAWLRRDIRSLRINIREQSAVAPQDRSAELDYGSGFWKDQFDQPCVFRWVAPDIYYAQLYFEDVALERYGQTAGPYKQFFRSGIHFFRAVATLPNKVCNDTPLTLDYPLGFCRPGSATPLTETRHRRPVHR